MHRKLLLAFLLAFLAASAVAQSQIAGRFKFVHAYYENQASVDISITTQSGAAVKNFLGLPYKGAIDWFYLQFDTYSIVVSVDGNTIYSGQFPVQDYSVVISLVKGKGPEPKFVYDNIDPIMAGKAHVSVANYGALLYYVDVGTSESTFNLAQNLGSGAATGPVAIDAGLTTIDVRLNQDTGVPLFSLTATLESRKHYLVIIVGIKDGTPAPELVVHELTDYSTSARLAFFNGMPGDTPVNVAIADLKTLFRNVNFKGITDYMTIPVGIHNIGVVNATGDNYFVNIGAFFNGFSESTLYAVAGDVTYGNLLADNNAAPDSGNARLRVLHGASTTTSFNILFDNLQVVGGLSLAQSSAYLPLSAGTVPIKVQDADSGDIIVSFNMTVTSGAIYTIAAIGSVGGSGIQAFRLIIIPDAKYGDSGNLRAVHAVNGGPKVNVKVGDTILFGGVALGNVSNYVPVESGLYRVAISDASTNDELFASPVRIDAGGYFTAVAGSVLDGLFQFRDDDTPPAPTTANFRVVHAASDAPEVNIEFGGSVVSSLIYTEAFGYNPVPAGSYVARVLIKAQQEFNGSLTLEADTVVSAFAIVNGETLMVVPVIDFDYRTPIAPPTTAAPVASTPSKTPTRTSSASVVTVSASFVMLAALI